MIRPIPPLQKSVRRAVPPEGTAVHAGSETEQVSERAKKAFQAHRAETEAMLEGRGHADKAPDTDRAQQARHSQAAHAVDSAEGGVATPAKPHAVQGKATEAAAHGSHATVHSHQEVGSTAGCMQASELLQSM